MYGQNGSLVIYKGGTSYIAQMSWSLMEESLIIRKHPHSQNMRIYGGRVVWLSYFGKGSFIKEIMIFI